MPNLAMLTFLTSNPEGQIGIIIAPCFSSCWHLCTNLDQCRKSNGADFEMVIFEDCCYCDILSQYLLSISPKFLMGPLKREKSLISALQMVINGVRFHVSVKCISYLALIVKNIDIGPLHFLQLLNSLLKFRVRFIYSSAIIPK